MTTVSDLFRRRYSGLHLTRSAIRTIVFQATTCAIHLCFIPPCNGSKMDTFTILSWDIYEV